MISQSVAGSVQRKGVYSEVATVQITSIAPVETETLLELVAIAAKNAREAQVARGTGLSPRVAQYK